DRRITDNMDKSSTIPQHGQLPGGQVVRRGVERRGRRRDQGAVTAAHDGSWRDDDRAPNGHGALRVGARIGEKGDTGSDLDVAPRYYGTGETAESRITRDDAHATMPTISGGNSIGDEP